MIVRQFIHNKCQIHTHRLAIGARAGSTFGKRNVVVEDAGCHGVGFGFLLCFAH